jgi:tight adherence protein C
MTSVALILSAMAAALAAFLLVRSLALRVTTGAPVRDRARSFGEKTLSKLAARLAPKIPESFKKRVEKRSAMAGLNEQTPAERLAAMSLLGLIFGALLGLFMWSSSAIFFPLFTLAGGLLPTLSLDDRVKRRHNTMLRQLPFHLDLLTLGVEAGLDFTAALAKMVEKGKPGPLREEFSFMLSQIRVGVSRSQAMRDLATRVDLPQLTTFLSALIQADKLGMSIGKVLRVQSESVRVERSQRAEKRANEAPVKILIPLVLFVFPTIWIILFAPMIFSFAF